MITLLSPSKKLNFKYQDAVSAFTQCDFIESAQELVNQAKNLTSKDLKDLMKISDSLADLNKERFNNWSLPFNQENSKQAILAFDGGVYSGLEAHTFNQKDLDFAQDHLRILSGLYGVLKPLDLIQPYRLEMGSNLKNDKGHNLYQYWSDIVSNNLNLDLEKSKYNKIINLASVEYSKVINTKIISADIINPQFLEEKNNTLKNVSFFSKKARGSMARFILKNKILNHSEIKDFNYVYVG